MNRSIQFQILKKFITGVDPFLMCIDLLTYFRLRRILIDHLALSLTNDMIFTSFVVQ